MKKVLVGMLLLGLFLGATYVAHNYTRKDCEVVMVENGVVRFEDNCGFYWDWEIEENEYFEVGDFVDLKMHDNCTGGNVEDDTITKVVFKD
jgi:hypothetical protein